MASSVDIYATLTTRHLATTDAHLGLFAGHRSSALAIGEAATLLLSLRERRRDLCGVMTVQCSGEEYGACEIPRLGDVEHLEADSRLFCPLEV